MKKTLLPVFVLASLSINAQTVQSIVTAGGTGNEFGRNIARDANGNMAVAGNALGAAWSWGTFNLTNAGQNDIIVAEYDAAGAVLWANEVGSTGSDAANGLAIDPNGNVFICGSFQNTFTWGTNNMATVGGDDLFLAKYDNTGNLLYVKQFGSTANDRANAIAIDNNGNVYIAGYFGANFTFGTTALVTGGGQDMLIAKFDNSGNVLWVKTAGGTGIESGRVLTVDAAGNAYVGGTYGANFTYGTANLTNAGLADIFEAKYDASGNLQWANGYGGTGQDQPMQSCKDNAGNIFTCGYFQNTFTFGTTTITSAGAEDIFLAQYNPSSGNLTYVKSAGGTGTDEGLAIYADASNNIFLTGFFQGSFIYGPNTLTSAGSDDELLVKYDPNGNVLNSLRQGGTGLDRGRGITIDAAGYIYIVGEFQGNFNYGSFPITSAGTDDIYLSTWCTQPPAAPVITQNVYTLSTTATGTYQWYFNGNPIVSATNSSYTATQTGNYYVIVSNACGASPPSNTIYVAFTGITDIGNPLHFSVFPIPSSGMISVNCDMENNGIAELTILDVIGNIAVAQNFILKKGANTFTMDLTSLKPGVYFTRIQCGNNTGTHRILIGR